MAQAAALWETLKIDIALAESQRLLSSILAYIDGGINKKSLCERSGVSATLVVKLGKGGKANIDKTYCFEDVLP